MGTTGSRPHFSIQNVTALRLLLGAALLLALAGLSGVLAVQRADAGAVAKLTVNSTANIDDGKCHGPPNDMAVGNCTLHEAIEAVNAGLADEINFHPTVFSKSHAGVIQLDQGVGELPFITREVVIDNTGTAVVLDCDAQNDQTWLCNHGLRVNATHNAFDFTLIGAKNFVIREISGDGILYDGGTFSAGDVEISGVEVDVNDNETTSNGQDAIDIQATNLNNVSITNSIAFGDDADSDSGIIVGGYGNANGDLSNNNLDIKGNRVSGLWGVYVYFDGDLYSPDGLNGSGHTANVNVTDNESIVGNNEQAVTIEYCWDRGDDCDARNSTINFNVNENGKISSAEPGGSFADAIRLVVEASEDGGAACTLVSCNDQVALNLNVNDNAIIDSETDDGVKIEARVCCATSDSTANISVSGNLDIVGDEAGVEVNAEIGEGPDNIVNINVDDNGEITGEGDSGVEIDGLAGSDMPGAEITDADENEIHVSVSGNDDIAGDNNDGVEIEAISGKEEGAGDSDRNITDVAVDGNGDIDGDDDGVEVDARSGTREGPGDADDNLTTVSVSGNGTVDGADDAGIDVDALAGHIDEPPIENVTGDGNSTEVTVDRNDEVKGHSGDGVAVDSFAGAIEETGEENHTKVDVINNQDITGMQGGGDGVDIKSEVCCDPDNENGGQTNDINISDNGVITGQDDDGIDINQICCSINSVVIDSNEKIQGNEDNGIEVSPCLESGDPTIPSIEPVLDPDSDLLCLRDSATELTITNNNISDSGRDGILVCCGDFQLPNNQAPTVSGEEALKSLIQDNIVSHNGEDGIDLDTTNGINIIGNEIFQNGTSATDGDNGVEIDWQFGFSIASLTQCFAQGGAPVIAGVPCTKVPAHFNRISENSIYDNVGLGINLIGITSFDPLNILPASGTEGPGWLLADGVGCIQFPFTPIAANDCIPYPKILFTGGPTIAKVSGTACADCIVEVFVADSVPADQTGPLGRQFGEGRTYLVSTESDELGDFSVNLPCGLPAGELTATNTDKLKNTSEFASNIPFPGTPACAAATAQPSDTPAPATSTPVAPTATSVPVEPTATPGPAGLCGDVNSDGAVNSIDAALILQEGAGMIEELPKGNASGDVNGDGVTNAVDAALILQDAASMIAGGLPC